MPWIYVWTNAIKWAYVWTTPVKEVYVWTTKIRPTYKREPWANTTWYFKFNWNLKDEISGTTYTASGITYWTLPNGNQYAIFPWASNGRFAYNTDISGGWNELTLHVWFQVANTSNMRTEFSWAQNGYNYYTSFIWESGNIGIYYYDNANDIRNWWAYNIPSYNINERHLFSQTIKAWGKIKIFLDWNLWYEKNMRDTLRNGGDGSQYIGARRNGSSNYFKGKMSEMIIENRERTEQEVSDYYNRTKSNYWL